MQPDTSQPQTPEAPVQVTPNPTNKPADYPGKTLSIVGFIFGFVGLQLVGLILCVVAYNQSKRAGIKNKLAFAGIFVNIATVLLTAIFIIAITLVSYANITSRADNRASDFAAQTVLKSDGLYFYSNGEYATSATELAIPSSITISDTPITSAPSDNSTVAFYSCSEGNKIEYWSYETSMVSALYSGDATAASDCTIAP